MDMRVLERRATTFIAVITVVTGIVQLVVPQWLLPILKVETTAETEQLFATVGFFMVLFGGAVLHAQIRYEALPVVLLWSAIQKLGAASLVGWGVHRGVFSPLALVVATFDFASGLLFFDLRRRGG